MLKALVSIVAVFAMVPALWAAESPERETLSYAQARETLLARGFSPYTMPGATTCDEDGPRCYPELLHCIHKRRWICDYTWRAGKVVYQLETHSDEPMVDSFYCLINCTAPTDQTGEDRLGRAGPLAREPLAHEPLAQAAKSP